MMEANIEEVWKLSWESLVEKEDLYISYSGIILLRSTIVFVCPLLCHLDTAGGIFPKFVGHVVMSDLK